MPLNKKIAIYIGIDNDNDYTWKKYGEYDDIKSGYSSFKSLCKSATECNNEQLVEKFNSPRLDIELRYGKELLKWFGIYEKDIRATIEKEKNSKEEAKNEE